MSFRGASDVPVEIIGGLVCDTAAVDLPAGVSPDCQDVDFSEDGARTRPGLGAPYGKLTGNVVNYLKTFETANGTQRAMAFTDLANLFKELSPGTFSLVSDLPDVNIAAPYCNSTTQFDNEWLAIGDGQYGVGLPRRFDDENLDRASQCGPGAAPTAVDEIGSFPIAASPTGATAGSLGIATATQAGTLVTLTLAFPLLFGLKVGDSIDVTGVGVGGYNGTFPIAAMPGCVFDANGFVASSSSNIIQYNVPTLGLGPSSGGTVYFPLATFLITTPGNFTSGQTVTTAGVTNTLYNGVNLVVRSVQSSTIVILFIGPTIFAATASGAGTLAYSGNIAIGPHQLSVIFVTRSEFLTAPAPPITWTAGGNLRAIISGIPIGPPNVIQRILIFTQSGGATFYYLTGVTQVANSNFIIPDNTTTQVTVDFTDGILAAGINAQYLFDQVELGECAGVLDYSDRLLWWGERAKVQNAVNLTFDGGFSGLTSATTGTAPNFPLGWTQDAVLAPGGASALVEGLPVVWGDAYAILTDTTGATTVRGKITENVYQDFLQVPIIETNTAYSVRAKVSWNGVFDISSPAVLHINLSSVIGGFVTVGLEAGGIVGIRGPSFMEFTAPLTAALATVPSDLTLQVYADNMPATPGSFTVDCIEIYPTLQPNNGSVVRASRAFQPESFDSVSGILQPNENNGQAVRAAFRMRERCFIVKEHSLYATQDDQTNEPSGWNMSEISRTVGTPSVRGVDGGEDWYVIAHRTGLYIFWGTEPQKISQEVGHCSGLQADGATPLTLAWDQINWEFGYTLWVTVDTTEKRILVGAPFGTATSPNAILMLDYRKIDPDEGSTGAEAIAANGPIRIRYTGMKAVMDKSRKWSPWTPSINSCALIERPDGTAHIWMGAGAGVPGPDAGAIYDLQRANLTDYSTEAQIPAYYWTAFTPQREQNQQIQTHEHRKSFKYLTMMIEGAGMVDLEAAPGNFNTYLSPVALPSLVLSSPAPYELETNIDVKGERVAFKFSASSPDGGITPAWFRALKMTFSVMGDPTTPVRGVN